MHSLSRGPNQSAINEIKMAYGEIKDFGSIEELKDKLIKDELFNQMKKSSSSWSMYLGKNANTIFSKVPEELAKLTDEIYQRRNIVVHSNGEFNHLYFQNVDSKYRKGVKQGSRAKIDEKYLKESISTILLLGIYYFYYYSIDNIKTILPTENSNQEEYFNAELFGVIHEIGYSFLPKSDLTDTFKNKLSMKVFKILWDDRERYSKRNQLLLTVNYAQSLMWLDEKVLMDEVLSKADMGAAQDDHLMCINILKGDYRTAAHHHKILLEKHNDNNEYLLWPIFAKYSKSKEYIKLVDELNLEQLGDIIMSEEEV